MDDTAWLLEVVEAMPDGVVIVADDGEILLVNREMEHITGYSRAAGRSPACPSEVLPARRVPSWRC